MLFFYINRKENSKGGSFADFTINRYLATMLKYDLVND